MIKRETITHRLIPAVLLLFLVGVFAAGCDNVDEEEMMNQITFDDLDYSETTSEFMFNHIEMGGGSTGGFAFDNIQDPNILAMLDGNLEGDVVFNGQDGRTYEVTRNGSNDKSYLLNVTGNNYMYEEIKDIDVEGSVTSYIQFEAAESESTESNEGLLNARFGVAGQLPEFIVKDDRMIMTKENSAEFSDLLQGFNSLVNPKVSDVNYVKSQIQSTLLN